MCVALLHGRMVAAADATPIGIYSPSQTPKDPAEPDARAIELGVRFRVAASGTIVALRFYKSAQNVGSHLASLWSSSGVRLAKATFAHESRSGWQTVRFSRPVAVRPGHTYVASYHTNSGHYAQQSNAFAKTAGARGALIRGLAGVYRYGQSAFPQSTFKRSAYFVDPQFRPTPKHRPSASATSSARPTTPATVPVTTAPSALPPSTRPAPSTSAPVTTTPPTSPPAGTAKPGPSNTGVPAGTKLRVVTGDQVYRTAGQVISGLDIHGYVTVAAPNVVIKDSIIRGGSAPSKPKAVVSTSDGASLTMADSEVSPANPDTWLDGVSVDNTTLLRMNIHGSVDGVKAFDNVTVQDSYIHDLSWYASQPNGAGPTHNDAVQTYEGNRNITLRHNAMNPGRNGNAAYQVTQDLGHVATNLRIEDNWLDGGGCTLNFSHKGGPTPMTGIYVTNNRFGRSSTFNCPILVSTKTTLTANSGNVWDDTGKPIPAPQRHD